MRVVKFTFKRSLHTINQHFHNVLAAILRLHNTLLAKPTPVDDDCTDSRWKYFKGCLGALDGTYIDVTVAENDKPRYRTRKRKYIGQCSCNLRSGYEIYLHVDWMGGLSC